ncbi:MAG TPA: cobyric acid synthase [Clostridiales bacterium]|nr:cobyric acid synthase [Clostridiales bacterium]
MAKSIMIQGTASGVGKSIITTGLCRIFTQDGHRTAPFKSQNMSSNAHMLADGREMARSQAVQAYACGIEPDTDMNPILLKPVDGSVEVILNGRREELKNRYEYNELKKNIWPRILEPYNRLCASNDVVVIEGAGSPVELNLNKDDIVNMGVAEKTNSLVILVSDIHRGGVFASVYGTLSLFTENERKYVKGIIINKCIGEMDSFKDVKQKMEEIAGLPVVGMVPYFRLEIEDEDNLIDPNTCAKTSKSDMSEAEYRKYLDAQFDMLASMLRDHLDIDRIYAIMEEGI